MKLVLPSPACVVEASEKNRNKSIVQLVHSKFVVGARELGADKIGAAFLYSL